MTTNSPVSGTVASAPFSHDFEPGATPHTLAKDLGLAAKAMEIAKYHCQLGTQARELHARAIITSKVARAQSDTGGEGAPREGYATEKPYCATASFIVFGAPAFDILSAPSELSRLSLLRSGGAWVARR